MLVVTRRSSDKISFPQVGITVHFIRVQGSSAKVGVDAPRDIAIVRDEVADEEMIAEKLRAQWGQLPRQVRHDIRNELHALSVGLHLYREQERAGLAAEAAKTFETIQNSIARIDQHDVLRRPTPNAKPTLAGTILVVEDNDNEREMLAGILRMQGHPVVTVADGHEAIEYLKEHDPPAAVLVDMRMPGCDGRTVVREIRRDRRQSQTKVFAVSGSTPEESDVEVGAGGVDRWFRKPLNPKYLVDAM